MDSTEGVYEIGIKLASLNIAQTKPESLEAYLRRLDETHINCFAFQNMTRDYYTDIVNIMNSKGFAHHRFVDLGCDVFVHDSVGKITNCNRKQFLFTDQNKSWSVYRIQLHNQRKPAFNIVTYVLDEESRGTVKRREQIKELGRLFSYEKTKIPTILVGDTCLSAFEHMDHDILREKNIVDVWEEIGTNDTEFTYDGSRNPFVESVHIRDRRERLWINNPQSFSLDSFELLTKDLDPTLGPHFGLRAELTLSI
jgi:hypothetical protein